MFNIIIGMIAILSTISVTIVLGHLIENIARSFSPDLEKYDTFDALFMGFIGLVSLVAFVALSGIVGRAILIYLPW